VRETLLRNSFVLLDLVLVLACGIAAAAPATGADRPSEAVVPTSPVRVDGAVLFAVRDWRRIPPKSGPRTSRTDQVDRRRREVKPESIVAVEAEQNTELRAGTMLIMFVFDDDAEREGVSRQILARAYVAKIGPAVEAYRRDRDARSIAWAAASAVGATLVFVSLALLIRFLFPQADLHRRGTVCTADPAAAGKVP